MGNFEKVGEFELKIEEIVKPMTRWTIILTLFVLVLQFVIHKNFQDQGQGRHDQHQNNGNGENPRHAESHDFKRLNKC